MSSDQETGNGHSEYVPPYSAMDILGEGAKNLIHKRPLLNAESMLRRGKYRSALEIYIRIIPRFKDIEAKKKIKSIVDSLHEVVSKLQPNSEHNPKLTHFDPEKDFTSALKELSDHLTDSLTEGLNQLEKIKEELPEDIRKSMEPEPEKPTAYPVFVPTSRIDVPDSEMPSDMALDYSKGIAVPPLDMKIQVEKEEPTPPEDYHGIEVKGKVKREDIFGAKKKPTQPPPPGSETEASSQKMDIVFKMDSEPSSPTADPVINEKLNLGLPEGLPGGDWVARPAEENIESPSFPVPSTPVEMLGQMFRSDEWAPFRHLPLQDRRHGVERRHSVKPVSIERRTGHERRKIDYFKLREDYLKLRAERLEAMMQQMGSQSHRLENEVGSVAEHSYLDFGILGSPPSDVLHPDLLEINLPDPVEIQKPPVSPIDQNHITSSYSPTLAEPVPRPDGEEYKPANEEFYRAPSDPVLVKIDLPDPYTMRYEGFDDAPKRNISWIPADQLPENFDEADKIEPELTSDEILYPTARETKLRELFKIDLPDPEDKNQGLAALESEGSGGLPKSVLDEEVPEVDLVESDAPPSEETTEMEIPPIEPEKEPEPERMIHGILELKPPEVDDAPFLTLTYDFSKIPHSFRLSKNYSIMEYSYYKYKPMLMKAQEFARRKMLKNALNYYRVIKSQNIPPELKRMINRNITDITEFLEKFLMSKGG